MRPGHRRTALIAAGAFAALLAVAVGMDPAGLLNGSGRSARDPWAVPVSPEPAADVALPGGGVSDGTRCGTKGFHHFKPAPASFTFAAGPQSDAPPPGPQLVLSSYGFSRTSQKDPGHFTIGLGLGPGPGAGDRALDLSAPLGPQGVAVEIEGSDGLVAGAHGLPLISSSHSRSTHGCSCTSGQSHSLPFNLSAAGNRTLSANRVWDDPGMLLIADGVTPVPRMMLVDDLETDSGGFCELDSPLFLAIGDRISFDGRSLSVTRANGETFSPSGEWGIRCRRGPRI
ncbi:hypothetical protein [Kitasatospora cathayae]|uniref:Secreted protein n=2 Tax=Kitasatospora TaxID=2063 RepID=A0ABY7QFB8_9ACTN|nr:hypothetical protein [Kitasatospora sp. HUAS 3-15]WBP91312.1 hypothetical protein O1G21_39140 [Kitasatospora sp. HUAS 3-15]